MSNLSHVAIIMDGNGRWASAKGRERAFGHIQGARTAKKIILEVVSKKIPYLTLFAFSTENWRRPILEVNFLMRLLVHQIRRTESLFKKHNIRFHTIGDLAGLPQSVQEAVEYIKKTTAGNTGLNLTFALNYGGRQEILGSVMSIAKKIQNKEISADQITAELFSKNLESYFLPNPDLIIRTSGEHRLSNFFLWQAAYSEIYLCKKHWPDFSSIDFNEALIEYSRRERRYGTLPKSKPTMTELNSPLAMQ